MAKTNKELAAAVAAREAAKQKRRDRVEEAFEERYGDARWAERIDKSPHTKSQLLSLIETEFDIDDLRERLDAMMDAGEETFIAEAPNGVVGRHPLRAELQALEGTRKNIAKALKLDLAMKDNIKSAKSKVSQIANA